MKQTMLKNILVLAACALLGTSSGLAADKFVRVKGDLKGGVTYSPTNIAAGTYTVKVETEGGLSHLGRARAIWQGQILLDMNLNATPVPPASWTVTTAHGETQGTVTWQAQSTGKPGTYGVIGIFQVNGGTGRFNSVTGNGILRGTVNPLRLKSKISVDAVLRIPKAKKK
jgi:hypothetical protein